MRLHSYAASANCLKVRGLLGLLRVPFELVDVDIFAGGTLADDFLRLNALRETPVLELDDGRALTQSNAILTFLADGTPWAGESAWDRGCAASWLAFEQEWVMPGIGGLRFRSQTGRGSAAELEARRVTGSKALAALDAHLRGREWLVGSRPTIADVSVWAYAQLADEAGLPLRQWPAVSAWLARVAALDGLVMDLAPYPPNARPGAGESIYD